MKATTQAYLKNQLGTNPAWAIKGLVKIYTLQTADEQSTGHTSHDNGVGFSGCDAEILSSFATQVNRGRNLSPKQMAIVFKKMPRYWKQIASFIPEDKLAEIEAKAQAIAALAWKKALTKQPRSFTRGFFAATIGQGTSVCAGGTVWCVWLFTITLPLLTWPCSVFSAVNTVFINSVNAGIELSLTLLRISI